MSARARRRVGEAKGQSEIGKQWITYPREMVESPALRVRSPALVLVMHRIEAEHMAHGAAENGKLIVTRRQFEEWGVHRDGVAPAIREGEALGFFEIDRGHAGIGGNGQAHRFRLTYVNDRHCTVPTHEWSRITTIEDAKRTAKEARADKDERAQKLGQRSARKALQKKFSVTVNSKSGHGNHDRESNNEVTETMTTMSRSRKPGPLSIFRYIESEGDGAGRALSPELAGLQWSSPRLDRPGVVWPIAVAFAVNEHSIDMPGSPRAIICGEMVH
jgi:hypothetical protein